MDARLRMQVFERQRMRRFGDFVARQLSADDFREYIV
jgi:hypothetical protein